MKKQRKKKSKKPSLNLKYIIYILLLIIFSLSAFIVGIIYTQKNYEKELQKKQSSIELLEEKIKKLQKENIKTKIPKYEHVVVPSEIIDFKKSKKNTTKHIATATEKNKKTKLSKSKPKLVIIIDDVAFKAQIKKLKAIPYKITPSFFPPTKRHPYTTVYAKEFSHYMVHVPMQAIHFPKPEPQTLNVGDSYQTILNRIKEIKKEFPKAKFINNHTGSKFTSDKKSMEKLFKALKTENLGFVDSKTTPYSKAKEAKKMYNIPLYSRNIFLDNEENAEYIRKQLKKAVKIAKRRGYAIAIGHPHTVTLETLKNSSDILKDIEVVYIDKLMEN